LSNALSLSHSFVKRHCSRSAAAAAAACATEHVEPWQCETCGVGSTQMHISLCFGMISDTHGTRKKGNSVTDRHFITHAMTAKIINLYNEMCPYAPRPLSLMMMMIIVANPS